MSTLPTLWNRYKSYTLILLLGVLPACTATALRGLSVDAKPEQFRSPESANTKLEQARSAESANTKLEQARSADAFVNFIGINTHLPLTDTAYRNYSGLVKPRLQELGIRHIRDNAYNHGDTTYYSKLKDLSAIGIKSTLFFHGQVPAEVVSISKALKGTIEAVEGPNETDLAGLSPLTYKGQVFPQGTRAYQDDIYAAVKNDPLTASLPVLMPSMGWGKNSEQLGSLSSGDIGNMHSYPDQGKPPTDALDSWYIPYARKITGNTKPLWSTETGYGTLPSHTLGVSEAAAAKYLPRLLFEQFNRNIKRVYLYQLIDPHPDPKNSKVYEHTGLIRNDGSIKPAYTALKNLTHLLREPGSNFSPTKLDYRLSGNTTNVHRTLLQKSNGDFYLILWQEVKSWDNINKKDKAVANQKAILTLNTVIDKAVAYQPIKSSSTPIWQVTSKPGGRLSKLPISVRDHPLIVKLVPARKK